MFLAFICSFFVLLLANTSAAQPVKLHIDPARLMEHVRVLSSDEFEGRGPATPGEEKTLNYLTGQFKSLGLAPGNPDGAYLQEVPLVEIRSSPSVSFAAGGETLALKSPQEAVFWSAQLRPEIKVENSDIVFVGYGVVAPEYHWDDFKGVDVRGKTLLMLVNDPAIPDPKKPRELDPKMFKGKEMTYYGRWTYKYEIAQEKGAAAAIIIHETIPAAYPFEVVINSNSRERFELKSPDPATSRIQAEGWITFERAAELCKAGGADLAELKRAALQKDFRPHALRAKANITITNAFREIISHNVLARLEGADPKHKDETLIYTAHWDHLGRNPALKGDQIYNGALDNASGVAGLLELARAFTQAPKPARSVLFIAVTAEEKGLLGTKYYATHPLYPLEKTAADLNMDGINPWGRTRDLEIVGRGKSTLEDLLGAELKLQGRRATPDSEPEKGYYYRSDHFEFAKVGVPALHYAEGTNFVGRPVTYGKRRKEEYTAHDYHQVSDEIKPDWDFIGGAEDVEALYQLGRRIAERKATPQWKKGAEFSRAKK